MPRHRDQSLLLPGVMLTTFGSLWLFLIPARAAAHGVGGRSDLPVPLSYFLVGAVAVLIATFLALVLLWRRPRLQEEVPTRRLPLAGWRLITGLFRVTGLLAVTIVVVAGLAGLDNSVRNPAPVLVWVVFWLVLPFAAAVIGDLYQLFEPWGWLARWADLGSTDPNPPSWGVWPAVVLFLGFVWLELVSPVSADPRVLALVMVVLAGLLLAAAHRFGIERGLASVDPFALYNRVLSALVPDCARPKAGSGLARLAARSAEPAHRSRHDRFCLVVDRRGDLRRFVGH